jgi:hypothetical protein
MHPLLLLKNKRLKRFLWKINLKISERKSIINTYSKIDEKNQNE